MPIWRTLMARRYRSERVICGRSVQARRQAGTARGRNRFDIDKSEATRVEAQADWDQKLVAADLGLYMFNVIA